MNLRNLMVLTIVVLGISILAIAEEAKVEWEYIKGGEGIAIIRDASFNEVWERVQDILFFEKFKMKGQPFKVTHEVMSIEKESGLITVVGWIRTTRGYHLKISIREKDEYIEVKTRCNSSWKKKATTRFFQLLKEGF